MESTELTIRTGHRPTTVDITSEAQAFVAERGDGLLSVFVPHATAGLAIMEAGSGSDADLLDSLADLLPRDDRYRHRHGAPGHGADHVQPAIVAPSVTVPVRAGRLRLGTWQSLLLVDTNVGNADRRVILSFLEGGSAPSR